MERAEHGTPGQDVALPVTSTDADSASSSERRLRAHVSSERRLVSVARADQVGAAVSSEPLHGRLDAYVRLLQRRQPNG